MEIWTLQKVSKTLPRGLTCGGAVGCQGDGEGTHNVVCSYVWWKRKAKETNERNPAAHSTLLFTSKPQH